MAKSFGPMIIGKSIDAIYHSSIVVYGVEYFYGGGKSFKAITVEAGPAFEFPIADHFDLGVEPFTVQAMVWNSTSAISKVPFNLRGESLLLLRGRW